MINWKIVFKMFLALQFGIPILVSAKFYFFDGDIFFNSLKDCLVITFFFLCLIFYIPLLCEYLKSKIL